jgi:hypothetical protein
MEMSILNETLKIYVIGVKNVHRGFMPMKVGDLVTDGKSHMDPTNLFYDAFFRVGIVLDVGEMVRVAWTNKSEKRWTTQERPSRLVVISESR